MKALKYITTLLTLITALGDPMLARAGQADSKGQVLVVLSGAHLLNLQDGKVYATGYYLNELATPLRALVNAGYPLSSPAPTGTPLRWMPAQTTPNFSATAMQSAWSRSGSSTVFQGYAIR